MTSGWVLNTFTRISTALPLSVLSGFTGTAKSVDLQNSATGFADRVPGVPVYLHHGTTANGKIVPGGIQLNPAAFTYPPTDSAGNVLRDGNSGRNAYRLFGLKEFDLSIGRRIASAGRVACEFKVEAFNILNTPNFANINTTIGSANFGQAQNSAAAYDAGNGGLNQVFQLGGPRNLQLLAKITF